MAELDPGVVGEVPIDLALVGVGRGLPGGELGVGNLEVLMRWSRWAPR